MNPSGIRTSARPAHFVRLSAGWFQPTSNAQSHWGTDHLAGAALVGLAASVLDEKYGHREFTPTRLTVDLFRAARGVPTSAIARSVRDGRRLRCAECNLYQGDAPVARAVLLQYRAGDAPHGTEWSVPIDFNPPADVDDDAHVYVGSDSGGWTRSAAGHQNDSRKRAMSRPIDAIEGTVNSPLVNAAMTAEWTSLVTNLGSAGIGYINGDLTLAMTRLPRTRWIGLQADSHVVADGIAVGTATLLDSFGAFGTGMVTALANPRAQIDFTLDPFPDRTP